MNNRLSPLTRYVSLICGIALGISLLFPLWRIDLRAPQYPEGLTMKIYPHKLDGDVEVINGLNHYIGMRTLHTEDFFEFIILPYLIGIFAVFGLLSFLVNRRWFYYVWTVLFVFFGIAAMFDFYRWEYNYGHNLDPSAPIIVPGMAYQPPLIGFKQLLNFGAWSFPDIGGYIFLSVGLALVLFGWLELRKTGGIKKAATSLMTVPLLFVLQGCQTEPQSIRYGKDACHHCKMTITDQRFGTEIITNKGKAFKFDDTRCMFVFMKSGTLKKEEMAGVYVVDFGQKEKLIPVMSAFWLKGEGINGPMGGKLAAFETEEASNTFRRTLNAQPVTWKEIMP